MPKVTPKIPPGLEELMLNLAKNIIKENPQNLYEFAAEYFEKLLRERDGKVDESYKMLPTYKAYKKVKKNGGNDNVPESSKSAQKSSASTKKNEKLAKINPTVASFLQEKIVNSGIKLHSRPVREVNPKLKENLKSVSCPGSVSGNKAKATLMAVQPMMKSSGSLEVKETYGDDKGEEMKADETLESIRIEKDEGNSQESPAIGVEIFENSKNGLQGQKISDVESLTYEGLNIDSKSADNLHSGLLENYEPEQTQEIPNLDPNSADSLMAVNEDLNQPPKTSIFDIKIKENQDQDSNANDNLQQIPEGSEIELMSQEHNFEELQKQKESENDLKLENVQDSAALTDEYLAKDSADRVFTSNSVDILPADAQLNVIETLQSPSVSSKLEENSYSDILENTVQIVEIPEQLSVQENLTQKSDPNIKIKLEREADLQPEYDENDFEQEEILIPELPQKMNESPQQLENLDIKLEEHKNKSDLDVDIKVESEIEQELQLNEKFEKVLEIQGKIDDQQESIEKLTEIDDLKPESFEMNSELPDLNPEIIKNNEFMSISTDIDSFSEKSHKISKRSAEFFEDLNDENIDSLTMPVEIVNQSAMPVELNNESTKSMSEEEDIIKSEANPENSPKSSPKKIKNFNEIPAILTANSSKILSENHELSSEEPAEIENETIDGDFNPKTVIDEYLEVDKITENPKTLESGIESSQDILLDSANSQSTLTDTETLKSIHNEPKILKSSKSNNFGILEPEKLLAASATKIQSTYRGYKARKDLKSAAIIPDSDYMECSTVDVNFLDRSIDENDANKAYEEILGSSDDVRNEPALNAINEAQNDEFYGDMAKDKNLNDEIPSDRNKNDLNEILTDDPENDGKFDIELKSSETNIQPQTDDIESSTVDINYSNANNEQMTENFHEITENVIDKKDGNASDKINAGDGENVVDIRKEMTEQINGNDVDLRVNREIFIGNENGENVEGEIGSSRGVIENGKSDDDVNVMESNEIENIHVENLNLIENTAINDADELPENIRDELLVTKENELDVKQQVQQEESEKFINDKLAISATKIQSTYRGYKARKDIKSAAILPDSDFMECSTVDVNFLNRLDDGKDPQHRILEPPQSNIAMKNEVGLSAVNDADNSLCNDDMANDGTESDQIPNEMAIYIATEGEIKTEIDPKSPEIISNDRQLMKDGEHFEELAKNVADNGSEIELATENVESLSGGNITGDFGTIGQFADMETDESLIKIVTEKLNTEPTNLEPEFLEQTNNFDGELTSEQTDFTSESSTNTKPSDSNLVIPDPTTDLELYSKIVDIEKSDKVKNELENNAENESVKGDQNDESMDSINVHVIEAEIHDNLENLNENNSDENLTKNLVDFKEIGNTEQIENVSESSGSKEPNNLKLPDENDDPQKIVNHVQETFESIQGNNETEDSNIEILDEKFIGLDLERFSAEGNMGNSQDNQVLAGDAAIFENAILNDEKSKQTNENSQNIDDGIVNKMEQDEFLKNTDTDEEIAHKNEEYRENEGHASKFDEKFEKKVASNDVNMEISKIKNEIESSVDQLKANDDYSKSSEHGHQRMFEDIQEPAADDGKTVKGARELKKDDIISSELVAVDNSQANYDTQEPSGQNIDSNQASTSEHQDPITISNILESTHQDLEASDKFEDFNNFSEFKNATSDISKNTQIPEDLKLEPLDINSSESQIIDSRATTAEVQEAEFIFKQNNLNLEVPESNEENIDEQNSLQPSSPWKSIQQLLLADDGTETEADLKDKEENFEVLSINHSESPQNTEIMDQNRFEVIDQTAFTNETRSENELQFLPETVERSTSGIIEQILSTGIQDPENIDQVSPQLDDFHSPENLLLQQATQIFDNSDKQPSTDENIPSISTETPSISKNTTQKVVQGNENKFSDKSDIEISQQYANEMAKGSDMKIDCEMEIASDGKAENVNEVEIDKKSENENLESDDFGGNEAKVDEKNMEDDKFEIVENSGKVDAPVKEFDVEIIEKIEISDLQIENTKNLTKETKIEGSSNENEFEKQDNEQVDEKTTEVDQKSSIEEGSDNVSENLKQFDDKLAKPEVIDVPIANLDVELSKLSIADSQNLNLKDEVSESHESEGISQEPEAEKDSTHEKLSDFKRNLKFFKEHDVKLNKNETKDKIENISDGIDEVDNEEAKLDKSGSINPVVLKKLSIPEDFPVENFEIKNEIKEKSKPTENLEMQDKMVDVEPIVSKTEPTLNESLPHHSENQTDNQLIDKTHEIDTENDEFAANATKSIENVIDITQFGTENIITKSDTQFLMESPTKILNSSEYVNPMTIDDNPYKILNASASCESNNSDIGRDSYSDPKNDSSDSKNDSFTSTDSDTKNDLSNFDYKILPSPPLQSPDIPENIDRNAKIFNEYLNIYEDDLECFEAFSNNHDGILKKSPKIINNLNEIAASRGDLEDNRDGGGNSGNDESKVDGNLESAEKNAENLEIDGNNSGNLDKFEELKTESPIIADKNLEKVTLKEEEKIDSANECPDFGNMKQANENRSKNQENIKSSNEINEENDNLDETVGKLEKESKTSNIIDGELGNEVKDNLKVEQHAVDTHNIPEIVTNTAENLENFIDNSDIILENSNNFTETLDVISERTEEFFDSLETPNGKFEDQEHLDNAVLNDEVKNDLKLAENIKNIENSQILNPQKYDEDFQSSDKISVKSEIVSEFTLDPPEPAQESPKPSDDPHYSINPQQNTIKFPSINDILSNIHDQKSVEEEACIEKRISYCGPNVDENVDELQNNEKLSTIHEENLSSLLTHNEVESDVIIGFDDKIDGNMKLEGDEDNDIKFDEHKEVEGDFKKEFDDLDDGELKNGTILKDLSDNEAEIEINVRETGILEKDIEKSENVPHLESIGSDFGPDENPLNADVYLDISDGQSLDRSLNNFNESPQNSGNNLSAENEIIAASKSNAAVKIQSTFRGYRTRKNIDIGRTSEPETLNDLNFDSKVSARPPKIEENTTRNIENDQIHPSPSDNANLNPIDSINLNKPTHDNESSDVNELQSIKIKNSDSNVIEPNEIKENENLVPENIKKLEQAEVKSRNEEEMTKIDCENSGGNLQQLEFVEDLMEGRKVEENEMSNFGIQVNEAESSKSIEDHEKGQKEAENDSKLLRFLRNKISGKTLVDDFESVKNLSKERESDENLINFNENPHNLEGNPQESDSMEISDRIDKNLSLQSNKDQPEELDSLENSSIKEKVNKMSNSPTKTTSIANKTSTHESLTKITQIDSEIGDPTVEEPTKDLIQDFNTAIDPPIPQNSLESPNLIKTHSFSHDDPALLSPNILDDNSLRRQSFIDDVIHALEGSDVIDTGLVGYGDFKSENDEKFDQKKGFVVSKPIQMVKPMKVGDSEEDMNYGEVMESQKNADNKIEPFGDEIDEKNVKNEPKTGEINLIDSDDGIFDETEEEKAEDCPKIDGEVEKFSEIPRSIKNLPKSSSTSSIKIPKLPSNQTFAKVENNQQQSSSQKPQAAESGMKTSHQSRYSKISMLRQKTMPVQIESNVMRILPKHLRKRIKSAEGDKKKKPVMMQ